MTGGLLAALLAAAGAAPPAAAEEAPPRVLSLAESFRLAEGRSEVLARSGAGFEEAVARARELASAALPRLSLKGTEILQHTPPGSSGLFQQFHREQAWISLRQPLFAGFREYLAWRSALDQGEAARLRLERARQLLYEDAARAHLGLAAAQGAVRIRGAAVEITEGRVRELRQRHGLGRSRKGELLAAEASLAQARADLELARAEESGAQLLLGFLTGLEGERLSALLPEAAPGCEPPQACLERARARPDVEAARRELQAAERNIRAAARRRWPTLFLDANGYLKRPPSFTDRVRWDATITAELPLYSGGETGAGVKAQEARRAAARAAVEEAERRARLEVLAAASQLEASRGVRAAMERAAALAEENARAQAEDYRLGQVSNLEALGALSALQEARLREDRARLDAAWAAARLSAAAGAVPAPAPGRLP